MTRLQGLWRTGALVAGVAIALGVLAACGGDNDSGGTATASSDSAEVTLRLGYVTTEQHPYGQAVEFFVEQVAEKSDGRVAIERVPTYEGGDVPLLEDVRGGAIEMASVSTAIWDTQGVTAFDALQAPFLITNYDLEREVIESDIGDEMLDAVSEIGLVGLAIHEGGLRQPLGADAPLVTPDDFDGLKIRSVESDVLATGLRALGADPTPIPLPDVYNALRDGTVDGMEANLGLIQVQQYYEVAEFVTGNVAFWPFPTALVMNQDAFDQLSDDDQQAITEAGEGVPNFVFTEIFGLASGLAETLCEEGLKFAEATEADKVALGASGQIATEALSDNDQTADFIKRIETIKRDEGLTASPSPEVPASCQA